MDVSEERDMKGPAVDSRAAGGKGLKYAAAALLLLFGALSVPSIWIQCSRVQSEWSSALGLLSNGRMLAAAKLANVNVSEICPDTLLRQDVADTPLGSTTRRDLYRFCQFWNMGKSDMETDYSMLDEGAILLIIFGVLLESVPSKVPLWKRMSDAAGTYGCRINHKLEEYGMFILVLGLALEFYVEYFKLSHVADPYSIALQAPRFIRFRLSYIPPVVLLVVWAVMIGGILCVKRPDRPPTSRSAE